MPYTLTLDSPTQAHLHLWPHNALNPRGFAVVIAMTATTLALPLLALVGSPVLWGILPFAGAALWGLWWAIDRNWRDRRITEDLDLSRAAVDLVRTDPGGWVRDWHADPCWVTLHLTPRGGPVENYLTLTGGGREVELGAFLTPPERAALHDELAGLLVRIRSYG